MRHTKKYVTALEIATINHSNQEQLYKELNRLGFFWNAVKSKWERDDRLPDPPSEALKIRLWASGETHSRSRRLNSTVKRTPPSVIELI